MKKTQTVFETSAGGIVYKKLDTGFLWLIIKHAGAGHWGFPKGHVGDNIPDEAAEKAALREVEEEGGIKAHIINKTPLSTQYFYRRGYVLHKKIVHYFLMEYVSGDIANHDKEVEEARWVSTEEAKKLLTYDNDKNALEKAIERLST